MGLREKGGEGLETAHIDKSFQEVCDKETQEKAKFGKASRDKIIYLCAGDPAVQKTHAQNTLQATEFSLLDPPHPSQMRSWNEEVRTRGKNLQK